MTTDQPKLHLELNKLNACIHCGMCLPACPTYRVTGSEAESPRGRLYLMRKMLEGELTEPAQLGKHLDQCLACHGCESVCPSGVQYGDLLFEAREALAQQDTGWQRNLKRHLFQHLLPNFRLLKILGSLLKFYQLSGIQALVRFSGVLRLLPHLRLQEQLLPTVPEHRPLQPGMRFNAVDRGSRQPANPTVVLMTGCVMDVFFNPVHWATIKVLTANDYDVMIPDQTCCGALAHHAGESDIARQLARQNIDHILKSNPDWIVVNSAGCGSTLKHYDQLLADDPGYREKAKLFSEKVIDVMALLARQSLTDLPEDLAPQSVCYHAACHLHHVQGVKSETQIVLSQVPNLTLVPLKEYDACCGSAGIYNIEHPQLAEEILAMKIEHLKQAAQQGAKTVATGNPGCIMQIAKGVRESGLPMQVKHPAEILAAAYRGQTI